MEFKELDFRDSEKKWYKIIEKEEIKIIDEVTKNTQSGDYYLGYVYVDHYQGLSMLLVGKGIETENTIKFVTPLDKLTEYTFAMTNSIISSFDNFRVEKVDENKLDEEIKEIIEEFAHAEFYGEIENKNPYLINFRKDKTLDESRAFQYPDSISFLLAKEGLESELIWGRVEGYHTQDQEVRAVLLNDPFEKEYGLAKGDVVGLIKDPSKFDGYIAVTGYKKNKKFKI